MSELAGITNWVLSNQKYRDLVREISITCKRKMGAHPGHGSTAVFSHRDLTNAALPAKKVVPKIGSFHFNVRCYFLRPLNINDGLYTARHEDPTRCTLPRCSTKQHSVPVRWHSDQAPFQMNALSQSMTAQFSALPEPKRDSGDESAQQDTILQDPKTRNGQPVDQPRSHIHSPRTSELTGIQSRYLSHHQARPTRSNRKMLAWFCR